ncbi:MAG: Rrf2 family transcriptional regulator [Chthoniobacteraceae bacterium]
MRISKKAEYALRALVAIARQSRSWSIQELSVQENIPIKFLEQILLALRHAGLLSSKRGVGGGYTLLRAPGEISLRKVLRILDGPVAPVPCAAEQPTERCTCPDPRTCPLRLMMTDVRVDINRLLEGRTIEDMLRLARNSDALAFEI